MYIKSQNGKGLKSYRPISLLAYARRTIGGAIAKVLMEPRKYSETQLGFQILNCPETAIIKHIGSSRSEIGLQYGAKEKSDGRSKSQNYTRNHSCDSPGHKTH